MPRHMLYVAQDLYIENSSEFHPKRTENWKALFHVEDNVTKRPSNIEDLLKLLAKRRQHGRVH